MRGRLRFRHQPRALGHGDELPAALAQRHERIGQPFRLFGDAARFLESHFLQRAPHIGAGKQRSGRKIGFVEFSEAHDLAENLGVEAFTHFYESNEQARAWLQSKLEASA